MQTLNPNIKTIPAQIVKQVVVAKWIELNAVNNNEIADARSTVTLFCRFMWPKKILQLKLFI